MANKTVISIKKPTPTWATWIFRIVFWLNKAILAAVTADPGISAEMKLRIAVYLSAIDGFVWTASRGLGVKIDDTATADSTDPKDPPPPKP
jgi:hypothetical protein